MDKDISYRLINTILYILLLGLGIYLIYQGDIVQRFRLKRSNFAVFTEPIVELPTIVTYFYPPINIKYKSDFNISLVAVGTKTQSNLEFGENVIQGTNLKVEFKELFHLDNFRIKPLTFQREMDFIFTFNFANSSIMSKRDIGIRLTTLNNTSPCGGTQYFDGISEVETFAVGTMHEMTVSVEKHTYLQDRPKCRKEPYVEEVIRIVENKMELCNQPCRPGIDDIWQSCWGLGQSDTIMKLPICKKEDKDRLKCFLDIVSEAKRQIRELPCTKVQYRVHVNHWQGGTSETSTTIHMNFAKPYHVTVHEEYLIYDLVAMVGAIGGTFGLCTGIPFREICFSFASEKY